MITSDPFVFSLKDTVQDKAERITNLPDAVDLLVSPTATPEVETSKTLCTII